MIWRRTSLAGLVHARDVPCRERQRIGNVGARSIIQQQPCGIYAGWTVVLASHPHFIRQDVVQQRGGSTQRRVGVKDVRIRSA